MDKKKYIAVYIGLGSNMGERRDNLRLAIEQMKKDVGKLVKVSSVYETEPWGEKDQDAFLNQIAVFNTSLSPRDLLQRIGRIERGMGRVRKEKNGPRIIDLDILLYGMRVVREQGLRIPHPELPNRMFVLIPLMELLPDFVHPATKKDLNTMLANCPDEGEVVQLEV